jgi:hypothetical protein
LFLFRFFFPEATLAFSPDSIPVSTAFSFSFAAVPGINLYIHRMGGAPDNQAPPLPFQKANIVTEPFVFSPL